MQACTLEMVHGLHVRQAPGDDASMAGRKKRIRDHACEMAQAIAKTVPDTVRQLSSKTYPAVTGRLYGLLLISWPYLSTLLLQESRRCVQIGTPVSAHSHSSLQQQKEHGQLITLTAHLCGMQYIS